MAGPADSLLPPPLPHLEPGGQGEPVLPEPTAAPAAPPKPAPAATPSNVAVVPSVRPSRPAVGPVQAAFDAGFRAAGGSEAQLQIAHEVVYAESRWDIYAFNPRGGYTGLGQWDSTWWSYGGGDIYDPWQQGFNMATRVHRDRCWCAWGGP